MFGVALPMACFLVLREPPLIVFAAVICAALAWRELLGRNGPAPFEAFVSGILFASIVPCALGLCYVPVALMGLVKAKVLLLLPLGLAPLPAFVVYAREWKTRVLGGSPAAVALAMLGALTPFALALGLAACIGTMGI